MSYVKVFGQFEERMGYIFRNTAYLQWGTSERSLGSFLLLNPGNSEPFGGISLGEGEVFFGEAKLDRSMEQVQKLVESIYGDDELDGRVHIYNLFSLRHPISKEAIGLFEALAKYGSVPVIDVIPPLEELKMHPWMCLCWGINSSPHWPRLNERKKEWVKALKDASIPLFGKQHSNGVDYFHICPRLKANQKLLVDELLENFYAFIPLEELGAITRSIQ